MGSSSRSARRRHAREWRLAVAAAVVVVLGVAGYAGHDVYQQAFRPDAANTSADVSAVPTTDTRRQVLVELTVTSDGPFALTYRDADGKDTEEASADGRPITVETVGRGDGPYLQVWAQTSPTASFVRCEIAVDNDRRSRETTQGPAAATYCAA
ncbi:hypothetical protein ACHAAC_16050 [Aeromicrobium sp. CF4.19]|uniref:hypothetical protein n=1 Tax=Aeromicrobium sp. CF4.19 TaxID=3373082 RepID=UPI003EE62B2B